MKMFANGIVMSKLEYGAEAWAGAAAYILKHLQSIQIEAMRTVQGPQSKRWSSTHLLKELNWLSINQLAQIAYAKLTHNILLTSQQAAIIALRIMT